MCGGSIISPTASAVPGRYRLSPPNDLSLQSKIGSAQSFCVVKKKIKKKVRFFCVFRLLRK